EVGGGVEQGVGSSVLPTFEQILQLSSGTEYLHGTLTPGEQEEHHDGRAGVHLDLEPAVEPGVLGSAFESALEPGAEAAVEGLAESSAFADVAPHQNDDL
ncbi:unnamed protein product, partial [Amoebophrya sp. A25]